jgi:hypothetical protein
MSGPVRRAVVEAFYDALSNRDMETLSDFLDDDVVVRSTSCRSTADGSARGVAPGGESHMTISAKWFGACVGGQKPGDVMMGNGMKMNVLELQKAGGPLGRP